SLFFLIPLIFTYTRIAWLALAGILTIVGLIYFRKLLLIGVLAFLLFYTFIPFFQERVNTLSSIGVTGSASWRLDLWRDIGGYIKKSPWLGYGPGTASVFLGKNIPRLMMDTEPHNDYLRIWLEGGIILLLSYLSIYGDLLRRFYLGFRKEKRPRLKMLTFFVAIFTLGILGASLTDNVIKDAVMQWNFWILAGSLLAVLGFNPKKQA
ncbi:MAG: O-antigen ligase family protein, partial [Acholeplasmataceae bacterium]